MKGELQLWNCLPVSGQLQQMLEQIRDGKTASAFGMQQSNRLLAAALAARGIRGITVYVCPDFVSARAAFDEVHSVADCRLLPSKDDVLLYRKSQSGENAAVRQKTLRDIVCGFEGLVFTSADALTQLFPPRVRFAEHVLLLQKGGNYDVYEVVARLTQAGYRREAQVTAAGMFSLRGDILDVWPVGDSSCIRVEFFGDEAESLRLFDAAEQVSGENIDAASIAPNTDLFVSESEAQAVIAALQSELPFFAAHDEARLRAESIVSDIALRLSGGDRDRSLGFVAPFLPYETLWQFVRPAAVVYDDAKAVFDSVSVAYSEHRSRYKTLLERGEVLRGSLGQLIDEAAVFAVGAIGQLAFHKLTSANRIFEPQAVFNFNSMPVPDYTRDYTALIDDLQNWTVAGYTCVLFCGSTAVRDNLGAILTDNHVGFGYEGSGAVTLTTARLPRGAIFHEQKTVLIGTFDMTRHSPKKQLKRSKKDVFVQPEVGDYVVHNVHGIGICEQITKLEMGGAARDYIVIRYAGGDKLYMPIENMDNLSKLVAGEEHPSLSKIGGADFARVKDKVKKSVKAMAVNLVELYAERSRAQGHVYSDDNTLLDEFSADFPYTETDDQITAIAEGLADLQSGKIMDRLLCGDVGYGKTEVALRLAFKVISEGKQVAFLSPTTILARQHYQTVVKRMERFGIRVASLTRFDSPQAIRRAVEDLKAGKADMVCGTHRLLSKDVGFRDLGLLILDEEQRFGVADKEKIKLLKKNVNVLSLSATPIPRTLHMSMVGIRDISVLDTPPADRIPVQTYVTEYTESLAADAINREVNRGGQVFVVYNRVHDIDRFAASIARLVPDLKIAVAHGQMPEGMLENVISGFVSGDSDVLVASTIIENGIDMPRANTMLVIDSDRLGLSQLYQLRGRVGRSNRLAYVYFTFDGSKILTETAYKRLDAITQFTELGSGFKIAMRDLEIRGAGNILGREQHGHIEKVGYDMYCKLLEQAVQELRGDETKQDEREIKVLTDFNAFIPESYVPDNEWRVRLYAQIARLKSDDERLKLMRDLTEIYGKVPDSAANLLTIGMVKNLALGVGATGVSLKKSGASLTFARVIDIPDGAAKLLRGAAGVTVNPATGVVQFAGVNGGKNLVKFLLDCHKN